VLVKLKALQPECHPIVFIANITATHFSFDMRRKEKYRWRGFRCGERERRSPLFIILSPKPFL
jgi:hypothetical protein